MFEPAIPSAAGATRNNAKPRTQMLLNARCTDVDDRVSLIRVRNLSPTGLGGKVTEGNAPLLDDDVTLVLRGEDRIYGRVVWLEGNLIGISFDRPFNMESLAQSWRGPTFEVSEPHANIGKPSRRTGLHIK